MDPAQSSTSAPPLYKTSKLAVSSLVLSILGLLTYLPCVPAILCGHIALAKIKQSAGRLRGNGFAVAGLIIGYITFFIGGLILLLALISFPAASRILDKAKEASAANNALQLKYAIAAYYTEYRKYPAAATESEDRDLRSDHELMDVLLGSEKSAGKDGLNPRRIPFFSSKEATTTNQGKYANGLSLDEYGGGELWDPWGNHYHIRIDQDGNGNVDDPFPASSSAIEKITDRILIWSNGKDGVEGTEDDIRTW